FWTEPVRRRARPAPVRDTRSAPYATRAVSGSMEREPVRVSLKQGAQGISRKGQHGAPDRTPSRAAAQGSLSGTPPFHLPPDPVTYPAARRAGDCPRRRGGRGAHPALRV